MRRFLIVCMLLGSLLSSSYTASPVSAQSVSCSSFDSWEWAQSVFESDPQTYGALDPDGNGDACPELIHGGFAPAFWTTTIPADVEAAQITRIIDGDTFEVLIGGVSNRVRIYRADTPETQNAHQCGGQQATDFATYVLGFNTSPNVYLEKDKNTRDKYGRELAYVWFEIDGQPYLLNHILINNGWAADVDYGDRKYDTELKAAAAFAKRHDLGVWAQCGGFGIPLTAQPTQQAPATTGTGNGGGTTTERPTQEAPVAMPTDAPVQEPPATGGCNPNYSPCVPNSPSDLDCKDIGFSVTVIGYDQYGLDRDGDGVGCESY
ncbi:MAG: thermonuclease family protein [Thermomicrobiales bacterium]